MRQLWWVSCTKFTVRVEVQDGIITKAAPIVKMFEGQPIVNLTGWAGKIGPPLRVKVRRAP